MNHDPAETAAATAAKAASDKPLIIKDKRTTSGDLVIDTTAFEAIKVTSTGRWQHQGDIDATGQSKGLFLDQDGVAIINGNTTVDGKNAAGVYLDERAQLTLNGDLEARGGYSAGVRVLPNAQVVVKGNTTLFGNRETSGTGDGLSLSSGAHWSSEGMLTADGQSAIAIEQATFNHHNDLTLQGKYSGLTMKGGSATINGTVSSQGETGAVISLTERAELVLDGDLEVKGNTGVTIASISQFSIKSPGKIAISGKEEGLSVGNLCRFSSEGPMTLHSTQGTALSISNAEAFNHQGTLLAESNQSGMSLSGTLATITGHTTANSKAGGSLYLSNRGQLIVNGPLEANAGTVGISMSGNSQLTATEAVTVESEIESGVKLSEQSLITFKGPTTIRSKRSSSINLASGATWNSRTHLSLESPFSTALDVGSAQFEHQGSLSIKGKNGLHLAAGAIVDIQGTGEAISEIVSEVTALVVEAGSFNHRGQLTLSSQGKGISLSKAGRVVVEGALAMNTPAAVAVQLDGAHLEHHGTLSLNGAPALAIEGKTHTAGMRNVLAITNASSATLKVNHPLTINSIMLANPGASQPQQAGSTVILDSPQLSVHGVIDLTSTAGGSLTLNGAGTLQLDTLHCSPGSRLNINGDYQVAIGSVIFDLDNATKSPAQLAFHLSPKNQLKIGQFVLPKSRTIASAPIIEITGSDLAIDFDLKNVDIAAFPAGRHWAYQAEEKGAPIRLISDASGSLKTPASAQLTLIPAEEKMPETTTIHQLTQALSAEESSEVPGIRQRQLYYYSAAGQAAPIALLTNASSLLIPTSSQLSSSPP